MRSPHRPTFTRAATTGVAMAAVLVAIGSVFPAGADSVGRADGNDTPGVLDIASVLHGHRMVDGKNKLVHAIRTWGSWKVGDINSNDSLQIEFQLPGNNRTSPPERLIVINVKNGELRARIYDTQGDPPRPLATLALNRPTMKEVEVVFARKWLRTGLDHYRYRVFTYFEKQGTTCHRPEGCADDAPDAQPDGNGNWLRHDL